MGELFVTDLDYDPCERENVCFLAVYPSTVYDLWRNPPCVMTISGQATPHRIRELSNHGQTKISDPRMAGRVHEDAWLV